MDYRQRNCRQLKMLYVISDWITTNVAFLFFNIFRYKFYAAIYYYPNLGSFLANPTIIWEQILLPVVLLGIYWLSGYYNEVSEKSRLQEFMTTLGSAIFNSILFFLLLLTNDFAGRRVYGYEQIAILTGLLFMFTYMGRIIITSMVKHRYHTHEWRYNTVIAGEPREVEEMERKLKSKEYRGRCNIVGYINLDFSRRVEETAAMGSRYMEISTLQRLAREGNVDQVVLAPKSMRERYLVEALRILFPMNLAIKIMPDSLSFMTSSIRQGNVLGEPMVNLAKPSIGEMSKNIKRTFDVVASTGALLLISPLMLAIAIAVKLKGGKGGILYSQERIGRHNRPFRIYKFRTMREDAESAGPQLSYDRDPRITPLGHWLRKYRLDELPQFWNVIRGDMSIVGPRPERDFYIQQITLRMPQYTLLHQVRPGITSWGMVKYGYAKNVREMTSRAKYDLIYLSNMSLAMDLKIMIYTVKTIVTGKGV